MGRIFNKTSITVGFDITNNKQPIDSRFIIDDVNNIFLPSSWIRDDNTPIIPYKGLIVCDYNGNAMSCINDSSEVVNDNGTDKPTYCLKSSWKLLGNLTDVYDKKGSSEVALSSLGGYNMYSYLLNEINILKGSISTNETILAMQEEITRLKERCTALETLLNWDDNIDPIEPTPIQTVAPTKILTDEVETLQNNLNTASYSIKSINNKISFNTTESTTPVPFSTTSMPIVQDPYTIIENMDNTISNLENEYNTLENNITFNTIDNIDDNNSNEELIATASNLTEANSSSISEQITSKQNIISNLTNKIENLLNKISFN